MDTVVEQMIAGLANTEHQSRIIAKATILTTLEQELVSLEITDKSILHLHDYKLSITSFNVQRPESNGPRKSRHHIMPRLAGYVEGVSLFSLQLHINNRTCVMPLLPLSQVHLLLQDKGHNNVFIARGLDNSDFNIAGLLQNLQFIQNKDL